MQMELREALGPESRLSLEFVHRIGLVDPVSQPAFGQLKKVLLFSTSRGGQVFALLGQAGKCEAVQERRRVQWGVHLLEQRFCCRCCPFWGIHAGNCFLGS